MKEQGEKRRISTKRWRSFIIIL